MDSLRTQAQREVQTALAGYRALAVGAVDSYNPADHTARVTLQPEGDQTGDLPVLCLPGLRAPLVQGMSCLVAWDKGGPVAVLGTWYDTQRPAPAAPFVFSDAVHVLGPLTLSGLLTPAVVVNLPAAGPAYAHAIVAQAPTTSVDGALWYCQPKHDGSYAWRQLTLT